MNAAEFAYGAALIVLLLVLASYFGFRQLQTLRSLREPPASPEDHRYLHRQAWRRLTCSALMLLFAGMLVGWVWLEAGYRQVMDEVHVRAQLEPAPEVDPEHRAFFWGLLAYFVALLLVLLAFLQLAVLDMWAIARFGWRHHRQICDDHDAMLAHQVARLRSERNGHG